LVDKAKTKDK